METQWVEIVGTVQVDHPALQGPTLIPTEMKTHNLLYSFPTEIIFKLCPNDSPTLHFHLC